MTVEEVRGSLDLTDNGAIKNSIRNCLTVFQNDPVLQGAVRYNILTERIDIVKPLWWSKQTATLTDTDLNYLMLYLEDKYSLTSEKKIQKALSIIADSNKYHPIRDYLNGLEWDGTERIRYALPRFLGAEEGEYIHSEKDILKLVTTLIANTKGEGKAGDDFWVKAETLLYCALIGYIHYEAPVEEQNFSTLIEFINAMEVREDDEEFKNPVDLMFDALEAEKPNHFAVRQYKKYKLAAGKTAKSILISCGARLAVFDIAELREVTAYDELELDTLGDRKTALFLIMSDTDDSFNFLISMCYTQLFNLLCEKADDVYGGRLPVHVRCLIDECANIGQIPKLEKLVATIRSREISACLVLQAQSQLKAIYKDNADTIIGNMDTSIFLGGKEPTTLKELAAVLGKETIDTYNTGESRGRETSHSLNYQKLGKELMSQDELAVMDGGKCILQLRGVRPFLSDKYDITKHPNFKYTADADDKNAFDIEAFLSARLKLKLNEVCDVYEVDTKGA